jgi:hypothetical protein
VRSTLLLVDRVWAWSPRAHARRGRSQPSHTRVAASLGLGPSPGRPWLACGLATSGCYRSRRGCSLYRVKLSTALTHRCPAVVLRRSSFWLPLPVHAMLGWLPARYPRVIGSCAGSSRACGRSVHATPRAVVLLLSPCCVEPRLRLHHGRRAVSSRPCWG